MYSTTYDRALADATEHHASSKTYSGKLLRPHARAIKQLIEHYQVRTIIDVGCGKGEQYRWVSDSPNASIPVGMTIEQYWGMAVSKFDPAFGPYSTDPGGMFDLAICTHVLGSIPTGDLTRFAANLFSRARKAVYIAEKIGDVRKAVFRDGEMMPRGWGTEQWFSAMRDAWVWLRMTYPARLMPDVWLATREKIEGRGVVEILQPVNELERNCPLFANRVKP